MRNNNSKYLNRILGVYLKFLSDDMPAKFNIIYNYTATLNKIEKKLYEPLVTIIRRLTKTTTQIQKI